MLMQGKPLHTHVSCVPPFLALVSPFRKTIQTMGRVFDDGSWVIENFNDQPVTVELDGTSQTVQPRNWIYPAFLTNTPRWITVCHCFAEAVRGATPQHCLPYVKQWHTVVRNAGYRWKSANTR